MLYGLRLDGWGSWDSPYKAEVISINPNTAAVSTLFKTPYHTIMGLAKKPGEDTYYTWVNWTSHFYAKIDLDTKTVTSLGQSKTGVISAIVFQNFHVAKAIRRKMY